MKERARTYLRKNCILLLVIAISFACACVSLGRRMSVEAKDKTYDIVADYAELAELARQSEHDAAWWMTEWKKDGVNKIALYEETLSSLEEEHPDVYSTRLVYQVRQSDPDWRTALPDALQARLQANGTDDYDVLVTVHGREPYEHLREAIHSRYPDLVCIEGSDGNAPDSTYYFYLDGTPETTLFYSKGKINRFNGKALVERREPTTSILCELSLCLDESKVALIEGAGCTVIPRSVTYAGFNGAATAKDAFADYEKAVGSFAYYFAGNSILGADDSVQVAADYMTEHHVPVMLVETTSQLGNIETTGMPELLALTENNCVRTFTTWDYIQYRYGYFGYDDSTEIQNTFYRAISERNVRVIYYKPIKWTDDSYTYVTDVNEYHKVFQDLEERLSGHGITLGTATPQQPVATPFVLKLLITYGAVAAAILLLETLIPVSRKAKYILLAIGAVGVVGCYYAAPNLSSMMGGLASVIIGPCLACSFYMSAGSRLEQSSAEPPAVGRTLVSGICLLIGSAVLALLGGLMAAAPFSETAYLLEEASYRGIKASQILPMGFAILAYMTWFGFRKDKKNRGRLEAADFTVVLNADIKIWMALIAVVLAACAYIYIARTGHTGSVSTPTLEIRLRNLLEEIFPARPRTKEFLIAFPCLMLFVYAAEHRYRFFTFVFSFGSVIGFASIGNSYMHLRTPLYICLYRLAASLPIGIVLGTVCVLAFHGVCLLWGKTRRV